MAPGRGRGGNWVLRACVAGAEQHCIATRWCTNPPRRTWKKKAKIARWNQEAPPSSLQWPATALYWPSLGSQHSEREMLGSSPLTHGRFWADEFGAERHPLITSTSLKLGFGCSLDSLSQVNSQKILIRQWRGIRSWGKGTQVFC